MHQTGQMPNVLRFNVRRKCAMTAVMKQFVRMVSVSVSLQRRPVGVRTTAYSTDTRSRLISFRLRLFPAVRSLKMPIKLGFVGVFQPTLTIKGNVRLVGEHVTLMLVLVHRSFPAHVAFIHGRWEMHPFHVGLDALRSFGFKVAITTRVFLLHGVATVHVISQVFFRSKIHTT